MDPNEPLWQVSREPADLGPEVWQVTYQDSVRAWRAVSMGCNEHRARGLYESTVQNPPEPGVKVVQLFCGSHVVESHRFDDL